MNTALKNAILMPFNCLYKISPQLTLRTLFRLKQGYSLNLDDPASLNEKIQWIKLYDRNPLFPICSDKYAVREYVTEKGCGDSLNELLWEGANPEEIPFDSLPDKYVVKATHGSTFNYICLDNKAVDRKQLISKCKKWLNSPFLPCYGEWFYGVYPPRIIVEKFLESPDGLPDFKIYCYNGKPSFIAVHEGRFGKHTSDLFTPEWKHIDGVEYGYPNATVAMGKPKCLSSLLDYANKLSKDFNLVRVDYYVVDEKPIFGELTFTDGAGFDRFNPQTADFELGKGLRLPLRP